jgi:hypothetical protein
MFVTGRPFQPSFSSRPEPTEVEHFSGALLLGRLLASPANIILDWKGLPGTNSLAYYKHQQIKGGNTKGGSITLPLTSCLTGLESTDNFCFYLQNRLIQTSQTGGQRYSNTSPFSIPCLKP